MIDANELRIGNWVNVVPQNYYLKIIGDHITAIEKNSSCADPIPLTTDILMGAGFVPEHFGEDGPYWSREPVYLSGSNLAYRMHNPNGVPITSNYIEFVHELQNLCFALTGEELEINL